MDELRRNWNQNTFYDLKGWYIQYSAVLVFYVNSFMRKAHLMSPLGGKVIMKQRVILQEDYDIFHFGNLSQYLGIKVKLGKFSPYFSHGRNFHLYVDMLEVATGSRKVGVY